MINGKINSYEEGQNTLDFVSALSKKFATDIETFVGHGTKAFIVTVAIPVIQAQPEFRGIMINSNGPREEVISALNAAIELLKNPERGSYKEVKADG